MGLMTHAQDARLSADESPDQPLGPLAEVVAALRAAFGRRLRAAVLFGSRARGDATVSSDADVLVVIEGLPADPVKRVRAVRSSLLPILDHLEVSVGFVAKTPEEVAANLTPLLLDVCVDGVCLLGEDYFVPLRRAARAALSESGLQRRNLGGTRMWVFPGAAPPRWELSWDGFHGGG